MLHPVDVSLKQKLDAEKNSAIINAKLENQWDLLEKAFTDFFKKKQIE